LSENSQVKNMDLGLAKLTGHIGGLLNLIHKYNPFN
jgi:hypothetical protein